MKRKLPNRVKERHAPQPTEPACPLCGPAPPGQRSALCYEHWRYNFTYAELFLRPWTREEAEEAKE